MELKHNPNAGRPIKKVSKDHMTRINLGEGKYGRLVEGNFVGGSRWEVMEPPPRRTVVEK